MKHTQTIRHIKGVIPAMFSTFDKDEKLDLRRAGILVDHLVEAKVDGSLHHRKHRRRVSDDR